MAAFSYQHQSFLLDSSSVVFSPPSPPTKVFGFLEEPNSSTGTEDSFSSQFYPYHHQSLHEIPNHENGPKVALTNNNEPSATNKQSTDSASLSAVIDYKPKSGGEQVTQKQKKKKVTTTTTTTMEKKRKNRDGSSMTSLHESMDGREVKGNLKRQKKCNGNSMRDHGKEKKPKYDNNKDQIKQIPREEEAPTGYIHVRARRGQATDSHSLAERVRREKISMRMKKLQGLVPGCEMVTGKALVLDEIINYVQSLQSQVEFLSMKLASVNLMFCDFGMDLDAFMITPERINSMESPLINVQQCNPAQATAFSDTTTTAPSSYPLLDSPSSFSLLFDQHLQRPNFLPQENGQVLWDMDDQRQNLINQSGLSSNLCSFH